MTTHPFRFLALIPVALADTYNGWLLANIDPAGGDRTFTAGLNVSGNPVDPVTHRVSCIALTEAQLKTTLETLCPQAGLALPANWDTMHRSEQRDWTQARAAAIEAATGLATLAIENNEEEWSDFAAAIAAAGLKPISEGA